MSTIGVGFIALPSSKIQADTTSPQPDLKGSGEPILVQTIDGQIIELSEDQYLVLEDDVVLILDQLAQNPSPTPSLTSGKVAKIISGIPVQSGSGHLVQTTHSEPLWSGERGSVQTLIPQRYELAQNVIVESAEEATTSIDANGILAAGVSLSALIVGLFGFSPEAVSEGSDASDQDGSGSGGGPTTYSGTVIKGPLLNAFIFLDENGNGVFDTGEPNFTTSASGGFSISSSAANPKLIVITDDRTIDTTTGNVFSGMTFKAPKEAKVISPLTTMMEETGLNLAEIKSVLGLPATVNPLTFNPYAPGVNAADALAAEQVSAQTMVTLAAFAAAAAGTGISQQDAFSAALSALSSVMQSKNSGGGIFDLTDPTDLAAVQSAFTTAVGSIPGVTADQTIAINGIIGDATTAIQNVNNKIASITNTDLSSAANGNTFGLLQVLQDQVEQAAEDEKTTPGSVTIGFTDPTAVDNAATNSAPTDIDLSATSISEDASSLVVGVLTTTDDSTSDFNFTYEIAEIEGSNDHSAFSINQANGELSFVSQPDFETKSSYTVTIIATDEGGKSFSETFTISVMDSDNESLPVFSSGTTANFAENGTGTVYTAVATDADGDTPTYHLVGGVDQALFDIDSSSGALTFKSAPDYETPTDASSPPDNVYEVQIEARDGNGGTASQTVSITVTNANDNNPAFSSGATANFAENGTGTVYTAVATDADGDTPTYHLVGGADQALFDIDSSSGALTFKSAPDYETPTDASSPPDNVYEVQIEARDGNGGTVSQTVSITVKDNVSGLKISGISAGDSSGAFVEFTGDINADGYDDIVIGAYGADPNGERSGQIYVVFGNTADHSSTFALTSINGTNGFVVNGKDEGDLAGHSVSKAGDVNNDGLQDLLIGALYADTNGTDSGEAYLIFGKKTDYTASLNLSSLDGLNGFVINGVEAGDASGAFVSSAGDVNGDSFDDLLIGAPYADPNGEASGESYVIFGKASGYSSSFELSSLDGSNGFTVNGNSLGDSSGYPVSAAGDVNGDGFADILLGAVQADQNGEASGSVYVIFGGSHGGNATLEVSALDGSNGFEIQGANSLDFVGIPSNAGDINGDGYDDIIVGARSAADEGASYVIFGKPGDYGPYLNVGTLDGEDGFTIKGIDPEDASGVMVASAGDINNDGFDDLVIGAYGADPNGEASGESYVIFGKASGYSSSFELSSLDGSNGFTVNGVNAGDRSGSYVSGTGDFNNDGFDDLLIGAPYAAPEGEESGETYLVLGRSSFPTEVELSDLDFPSFPVNQLPHFTSGKSATVPENQVETGYIPAATDADGDTVTFSIVGGVDANQFELDGSSGELKFKQAPDFENPTDDGLNNIYDVEIQADDGNGGSDTQNIAVEVENFISKGISLIGPSDQNKNSYFVSSLSKNNNEYVLISSAQYTYPPNSYNGYITLINHEDLNDDAKSQYLFLQGNNNNDVKFTLDGNHPYLGQNSVSIEIGGDHKFILSNRGYEERENYINSSKIGSLEIFDISDGIINENNYIESSFSLIGSSHYFGSDFFYRSNDQHNSDLFAVGASEYQNGVYYFFQDTFFSQINSDVNLQDFAHDFIEIKSSSSEDSLGWQLEKIRAQSKEEEYFAFGAIVNNSGYITPGSVYFVNAEFLKTNKQLNTDIILNESTIDGVNIFKIIGIDGRDFFGWRLKNFSDWDNDGVEEIIISARGAEEFVDPQSVDEGEVYILNSTWFLDSNNYQNGVNQINGEDFDANAGVRIFGSFNRDAISDAISTLPDITGDGFDELVISSDSAGIGISPGDGEVYVLFSDFLQSNSVIHLSDLLFDGDNGVLIRGDTDWQLGIDHEVINDIDGDGYSELLIGAPGASINGAAYVVFSTTILDKELHVSPGFLMLSDDWV